MCWCRFSFPSSAWERRFSKLRFASESWTEARPNSGSGASRLAFLSGAWERGKECRMKTRIICLVFILHSAFRIRSVTLARSGQGRQVRPEVRRLLQARRRGGRGRRLHGRGVRGRQLLHDRRHRFRQTGRHRLGRRHAAGQHGETIASAPARLASAHASAHTAIREHSAGAAAP